MVQLSLQKAKDMGFKAVVMLGHPYYLARFGFKNCHEYNIGFEYGVFHYGLQVLELEKGYFTGEPAKFIY